MSSEITSLLALVETYLTWLSSLPGKMAAFTMPIVFIGLCVLEFAYPKRDFPIKPLCRSYLTNIGLFLCNSLAVWLLSAAPLLMVAGQYSGWGLLSHIDHPAWKALLSFLGLDLLLYAWHKACHSYDCLWQFHRVHHNDPYMNVSTAFRLHIVELLLTMLLKAAYIVLFGVDQASVLVNEAVLTLFIMFHHTNISFHGERRLGQVIIMPYLHRAHHSTERHEHDKNYGAVFALWDRLFRTFIECEPVEIGIKNASPQTLFGLIKFGFTTLPAPELKPSAASFEPSPELKAMIAEAAYYKAEKRAFKPGNELCDWLEAKKEIIGMVYGDQGRHKNQPLTFC